MYGDINCANKLASKILRVPLSPTSNIYNGVADTCFGVASACGYVLCRVASVLANYLPSYLAHFSFRLCLDKHAWSEDKTLALYVSRMFEMYK